MAVDGFGLVGSTLDERYRIDSVVAEGGFGVLYRGWHAGFDHAVAIKCLKVPSHFNGSAQSVFFEKFREEGKFLSRLGEHPSIVRVFDITTTTLPSGKRLPYMVLEWLEGHDLEQAIDRGPKPFCDERTAILLLRPAVDAMAFAHSNGIAHRNLKPSNLFLTRGRRGAVLKVLDFGIAKAMQDGETAAQQVVKTSSGFSAFSAKYGAPEQVLPKRFGPTGPWTDVHALGLIFTELTSGRAAYEGEVHGDFVFAIVEKDRPTPRTRGATVSDAFEELCSRCLSLDAKARFSDGAELCAAMDAIVTGEFPDSLVGALGAPAPASGDDASVDTAAYLGVIDPPPPAPDEPAQNETPPGQKVTVPAQKETAPAALRDPTPADRSGVQSSVMTGDPSMVSPVAATPARARVPVVWVMAGAAVVSAAALAVLVGRQTPAEQAALPPETTPASASSASSSASAAPVATQPSPSPCPEGMMHVAGGALGGRTIGSFCMDRTEVTTAAYTACVEKNACDTEGLTCGAAANFDTPGRESHPINCVSSAQASAYCASLGRRLPTAYEWRWAARSGEAGWTYPWGNSVPYHYSACWSGGGGANRGTTCTVGEFPQGASAAGIVDLVGNVHEWTATVQADTRLFCGAAYPHSDPAAFRSENGCFSWKRDLGASRHVTDIGFRCVVAAGPAASGSETRH